MRIRFLGRILSLLVLILTVTTVLVTFSSCNDTVDTTEPDIQVDPGFSLKASQTVAVKTENGGYTFHLYVDEINREIDLNALAVAGREWTIVDQNGALCKDHVISAEKSGDGFTVYYGPTKIVYRIYVHFYEYFTVTFEGFDVAFTVLKGNPVKKPQGTPSQKGFTFDGWDFDFSTPIISDLHIKAKWRTNTYTVTFDPCGGTVEPQSVTVSYGDVVTLPIPTLQGSAFTGWYYGSTPVTSGPWTLTANVTLTAQWDHFDYKITYDPNGGTVDKTLQGVSFGDSYTTPTPVRHGYAFLGWYCDGEPVYTSRYPYEEDKTYVAKWVERIYHASFVSNGGSEIASGQYRYEELSGLIPEREGYTFGGWFFDDSLTLLDSVESLNTVTLYAWWKEENKASDFAYEITENGVYIFSYKGSGSKCVIPAMIGGVAVTQIKDRAFSSASFSEIGYPSTVVLIGEHAFSDCRYLSRVNSNGSIHFNLLHVTSLGSYAFMNTALGSVTLPAGITDIQDGTFMNCRSLTSVSLGTILTMGHDVFRGCSSLVNVMLPSALKTIGNGVFADCTSLKTLSIPMGVTAIGDAAFQNCSSLETISGYLNSAGIQSIGAYAFSGCIKLASVGIPRGVTSVGAYAFENCKLLDSLSLYGVTIIEEGVFRGCSALRTVTVNNPIVSIGNEAFYGCELLSSIALGDSLISIGDEAFADCKSLKTALFGNKLSFIGFAAYRNASSLKSIVIPAGIKVIPESVFEGCVSLSEIVWHDGITRIERRAFADCNALVLTNFPKSLVKIEEEAFTSCHSLVSLVFDKTLSFIGVRAFSDCESLTDISYSGTYERFKGASRDGAFDGCENLKNISAVTWSYDDLRASLIQNASSGALWSLDRTLSFNGQRPSAVLLFRDGDLFYRNLVKDGMVNPEYIWTLRITGSTEIIADFTTTVTVSDFDCHHFDTYGYVILDLGAGFASLQNVIRCELTLEIYGSDDPNKLLYQAYLDSVEFKDPPEHMTEDPTRSDTNSISGIMTDDGAENLFDFDSSTRYFNRENEGIVFSTSKPVILSSYSLITASSQTAYPHAFAQGWTLYGRILNADGEWEWEVISRIESGTVTVSDLKEYHFILDCEKSYREFRIDFDSPEAIMLADIALYTK